MAKYILKQEAIYALSNEAKTHNNPVKRAYTRAAAIIEQITVADVQPVKHGRWEGEHYNELIECYEAKCSECGYESTDKYTISESHRYCERCGADMTGGAENDT